MPQTSPTTFDRLFSKITTSKGAAVDIVWTSGHAGIAGDEIAESLAKEAATEARDQPDCRRSTTM